MEEQDFEIYIFIEENQELSNTMRNALKTTENRYILTFDSDFENIEKKIILATPDLVIVDIGLPDYQGEKIIKILSKSQFTMDIPVVALTTRENIAGAYETGAVDFIRKPIDPLDFSVRVKSTLSLFRLIQGIKSKTEALEYSQKELEKEQKKLQEEKRKTDELLLNILPYEIAEQLKNKGSVDVKRYKTASVIFTDFKDFTKISEKLTPEEVIQELQIFFTEFDRIIDKHFLEKIKTIGDAYMCAGGLPLRNKSNPFDTTLAALEIQDFMKRNNQERISQEKQPWRLRLGIHTGSVVAGVIGTKKFAYDIWGDAVNTASRMESSGEADRVNVSGDTYKHIQDYFICEYRGKIAAKNKGEVDMYFVEGLKPEYRLNGNPIIPNEDFKEILASY